MKNSKFQLQQIAKNGFPKLAKYLSRHSLISRLTLILCAFLILSFSAPIPFIAGVLPVTVESEWIGGMVTQVNDDQMSGTIILVTGEVIDYKGYSFVEGDRILYMKNGRIKKKNDDGFDNEMKNGKVKKKNGDG